MLPDVPADTEVAVCEWCSLNRIALWFDPANEIPKVLKCMKPVLCFGAKYCGRCVAAHDKFQTELHENRSSLDAKSVSRS